MIWKDEAMFEELTIMDAPRMVATPPGPKSKAILDYQEEHESSVISYGRNLPMAIDSGKGATFVDVDGNVYIDFFSGAGVTALGNNHPAVLKAAHEQIDKVNHTLDIPSECRENLVATMGKILPAELTRVFFGGPTGSDAVEQAVKLARYNTGRNGILAFEGAYHGMTGISLALTTDSGFREGIGQLAPGVQFIPYPYKYRNPFGCPDERIEEQAADNLERVLDDSHSGYQYPAAVIVEAVQGEGGSIAPGPKFLQRVREITKKYGVLLICDEVQCGIGRTGKMFAFQHAGIVPDIVVMSKALGGGGFPISAIAYREELNTMPKGRTIGTFRGNMVAFAAGAAGINWMLDNKVTERVTVLGEAALKKMKEMEAKHPTIGECRGLGFMLAIEMVTDKESRTPDKERASKVRKYAHQRGVVIEIGGHYDNVARLLPPLVIPEKLLMKGLDILEGVIADLESGALK